MINGSTAFNNAVAAGGHPYTARISYNGTVISCDVISCTISKGSTGNEAFSVGGCFVPYIEMEVRELNTTLENKELKLEVGVYTDVTNIEWITAGYFTVTKVSKSTVRTTFTAVGRIASVLSLIIPTLTAPTTIASVISDVQSAVRSAGYSSFTISTSTVTTTGGEITEPLGGLNSRQLLEIVAGCVGGYLTEDNAGNVIIFKYNTSSTVPYGGSRMITHPTYNDYDYQLSNIKVIQQEAYELEDETIVPEVSYIYDDTQPYDWVVVNQYMASQSMFDVFCNNCIGFTYRPATIELAEGDPRLEGIDVLSITDTNSSVYTIPGLSVTHVITGAIKTIVTAPGKSEAEADSEFKGPITQQLDIMNSSVQTAKIAAATAKDYANQAKQTTDEINAYAQVAGKTVTQILEAGVTAGAAAEAAQASADAAALQSSTASAYASSALDQLNVVQNVVGVLDLLSTNATYQLTTDTEIVPGKWYFTRSGTSPDYVYTVVTNPDVADIGTYYEMTDIDSAVQNYVTSRLAVTSDGLWIQDPSMTTKILLSATDGVVLYGTDGTVVGKYGSTAQIGDAASFHIEMDGTELGFYQADRKVAYISNQQLYITQSVVLQQMDLGTMIHDGGLGQWSWKVHPNGDNPPRNNLNLKWVG